MPFSIAEFKDIKAQVEQSKDDSKPTKRGDTKSKTKKNNTSKRKRSPRIPKVVKEKERSLSNLRNKPKFDPK